MESETPEWAAVMNRLERLEKQSRRMKQIGVLVLVLIGAVLLMGQTSSNRTVEANRFVLRDESGRIRATLSMRYDGPDLELLQSSGRTIVDLHGRPDEAQLWLGDGEGNPALVLGFRRTNMGLVGAGPYLHLFAGTTGINLIVEAGSPRIQIAKDNEYIWKAP